MHGGTVRQTDQASYVEGSLITRCYDDEAATGGGGQFGTQGAECEPKTWSKTVKIQDKCVVRHDDKWWMNHKETWGKLIYIEDTQSYPTPNRNEIEPRIQLAQLGPMRAPMPMPLPVEPPPPARAPAINDNVPVIPGPSRPPIIPPSNIPQPHVNSFLSDYRSDAWRNGDGSWTFNTRLSGPLARVTTYDPDGKYYILAEWLPNGHLIVSRDELENLYRETLQKSRAAQRRDAAALSRHGMRVTRKGVTRLRCWSLDRFLYKRGVSDASHPLVNEYCRQLFEQARDLNSMSPSEYLNEREWFKAHGRLNSRAEFREEHLQTVVNDLFKSG
ncbi:PAAR-like domain-containing protein [Methylobacterium sp. 13MFTsu3.1M2]|uniref:PAAR-like domain-containing protein n=1 Tax=Methylobacterium sp. 13MFTsu3.1M2 TaxID=1502776 RepID=UPI0008F1324B|nr:PAAR-like domain-containing protein [Methylobacterium sp. 13MFTsu3.1M2]SFF14516.1 Novel toxin 15 [Methylobacterium sp. 13MFTsu3.1M2]